MLNAFNDIHFIKNQAIRAKAGEAKEYYKEEPIS